MKAHYKCPHCGERGDVELERDMDALPTDREQEADQAAAPKGVVIGGSYLVVRCGETSFNGCGARFVLDFEVRERPWVAVAFTSELTTILKNGRKLAPQIRKYKRTYRHETPPPVGCPGCGREFGEVAGYPDPMPIAGLCAVCNQELTRQLAVRGGRRR